MLLCTIKVCVSVCLCVGEYERPETETDRDSAYIKMAGKNIFYCNNSLWASLCLLMNRRRRHVVCMLIDLWAKCYSTSPNNPSAEQQKRQSVCFVKLLSYMSKWAARTKGDLTEKRSAANQRSAVLLLSCISCTEMLTPESCRAVCESTIACLCWQIWQRIKSTFVSALEQIVF